jgi:hypothetical protein
MDSLDKLLNESALFASTEASERSTPSTAIQQGLREYAGQFLNSMDQLPHGSMESRKKLQGLFLQYLATPRELTGTLGKIRDEVPAHSQNVYELLLPQMDTKALARYVLDSLPHDGDKLLMNDSSGCGGQSIDDIFDSMFEENPRPEVQFGKSAQVSTASSNNDEDWEEQDGWQEPSH